MGRTLLPESFVAAGVLAPCLLSLRPAGGRFALDDCKRWSVPGPGADGWLVTARMAAAMPAPMRHWCCSGFAADTPGVRGEAQPRIDGRPMDLLHLEAVELPGDALLCPGAGAGAEHALAQALGVA